MNYLPVIIVFLTAFLDQITKFIVVHNMTLYGLGVDFIGNFIRFTYVENYGMAFGLFSYLPQEIKNISFNLLTLFAIFMIIRFYINLEKKYIFVRYAFALILGGAIGNLFDKLFGYIIFYGEFKFLYGRVVDFIDIGINVYRWPTFNLADIFISVGMFILLWKSFFDKDFKLNFFKQKS